MIKMCYDELAERLGSDNMELITDAGYVILAKTVHTALMNAIEDNYRKTQLEEDSKPDSSE